MASSADPAANSHGMSFQALFVSISQDPGVLAVENLPRMAANRMSSMRQLKTEFQNAGDGARDDGLDLEQVYEDQDPGFFIPRGVKEGSCPGAL
jgi:hypothetical protein